MFFVSKMAASSADRKPAGALRAVLMAFLALLLGSVPLFADIQGGETKKQADERKKKEAQENVRRATEIPRPKDQTLQALRGVPLPITLEAVSSQRLPIEFRLGEAPRAGTLSAVQPAPESNERATVIYTPSKDSVLAEDSFTFRVKHKDTATSPSATVRIMIIDPKPELETVAKLDFGQVVVGESAVRVLEIRNAGTGPWVGRVVLPTPWRLIGDLPDVEIRPRQTVELRVAYAPLRAEASRHVLPLGPGGPGVELLGLGRAPLTPQPAYLPLALDETTRLRSGTVRLANAGELPAAFEIALPPRLRADPVTGEVPAKGFVEVRISLPPEDAREFQSPATVLSRGTQTALPVSAKAAPPLLRVRAAEKMANENGTLVLSSQETGAGLVLENAGGEPAPVFLDETPAGLQVIGHEEGKDLAAGEVRRVAVVVAPGRTAPPEGAFVFRFGEQKLSVPIRGSLETTAPAPPPVKPPAPAPDALLGAHAVPLDTNEELENEDVFTNQSDDEVKRRLLAAMIGVFPSGTPKFDRTLPVIEYVSLRDISSDEVTISWKATDPSHDYVVYRQNYRPLRGGGSPVRFWDPVPEAKIEKKGDDVLMTMTKLKDGDVFFLRFAAKTPDGRIAMPCGPVRVRLATPKARGWLWGLIGVVVVGGGWWYWRRTQGEWRR